MKTSKTELCARMNKAWEDCKNFLETHRQADETISAEDKAIYDEMVKKVDAYKAEIQLLDEVEQREAEMNKGTSKPITNTPKTADKKTGRNSDEYKKVFLDFLRGTATLHQLKDALQEDTNSEGGYLVPQEFERRLVEKLSQLNVIRANAHVISAGAHEKAIPVVASEGSAAWIEEEGSYSESDDAFGQVVLKAHKVGKLFKVSDELLADAAFDLEEYILNAMAKAIAKKEEEGFCVGTGDSYNQPTGIFTANGGSAGVTTAAANKITADELIDLVYSLGAGYRANAKWLLNTATIKAVRQLKDGNGQYLWQPALTQGMPNTLLGFPVLETAYAPTIAAGAKVIAFGDLDYYWIADREGFSMKRLEELYAVNGQVGFRGSRRVDGKITQSEAIKILTMHA